MRRLTLYVLALIPVLAAGLLAMWLPTPATPPPSQAPSVRPPADQVRMEVKGVLSSSGSDASVVVLSPTEGDPLSLLLLVEPSEASAITARLKGQSSKVPTGADALGPTIRSLGGKLQRVIIESAEPLASEGRMVVTQGQRAVELQAPAPDSIAVAVESEVPIFAPAKLLQGVGFSPEELEQIQREAEQDGLGGSGRPEDDLGLPDEDAPRDVPL